MSLRIRQIVLAARDLAQTVNQLERVLGVTICYRDPEVGKFGLRNALMTIGHGRGVQFLEVVSPTQENTAAGRHLDRHGDSGYMLILQTDNLKRDRERLEKLKVRIVWQATHPDISAVHLHPKDIGAAIVSLDQPEPAESWRWAGPEWQKHCSATGVQRVMGVTIAAQNPSAMSQRWAEVLDTNAPQSNANARCIEIQGGTLNFVAGESDILSGFQVSIKDRCKALVEARKLKLDVRDNVVSIGGTDFYLHE